GRRTGGVERLVHELKHGRRRELLHHDLVPPRGLPGRIGALADLCEATKFAETIERVLDDPTSRPHRLSRVACLHGVESLHVDAPGFDQPPAFISGVRIWRASSPFE